MCVSPAIISELKRIVKESEIMKCVPCQVGTTTNSNREDDEKWPKRNKDGLQELEIRLGNEHISFNVSQPSTLAHAIPFCICFGRCFMCSVLIF